MHKKIVLWLIPAVCLLLTALLIGFFLGRNAAETLRVQTERPAPAYVYVSDEPQVQTAPNPVDLNTADVQTLMTLPGVGEVLAQRIVDYRDLADGFAVAEQLLEIEGIGEAKFEQLRAYITVEGNYEDTGR